MTRFAAIDIGTNAMRLRILEVDRPAPNAAPSSAFSHGREIAMLRVPVRLGREVFLTGTLAASAIAAATDALRQFREAMDEAKVDQYRAVATSAVRESENGEALVERAYREAGVHVEIIEGIEEARLVQLAVTKRLPLEERTALLIDVGGGSTELTLLERGETRASQSLPIGTVRLLEAFLEQDVAVDARHAELVDEYVERLMHEISSEIVEARPDIVVATGGTSESLALLCATASPECPAIDVERMGRLVAELSALPVEERMRRYGLRADRADTIIPAAQILLHLARPLGERTILAPGVGLKEGILEELVDRFYSRWNVGSEEHAITKACLRLGARYHFDEQHGRLVSALATQIFDDLRPLHRLGNRDRLLLQAAAILHDVGDFIRYEGHHKHGAYIIEHSDIMGITPAERRVVASVARYHRKSVPDSSHPEFRELTREQRASVRSLAAILRLADALDREHRGKVSSVQASVVRGRLRLEVKGSPDRALETWTVGRKSALFRAVFDLDVEVVDASAAAPRKPTPAIPG